MRYLDAVRVTLIAKGMGSLTLDVRPGDQFPHLPPAILPGALPPLMRPLVNLPLPPRHTPCFLQLPPACPDTHTQTW